MAWKPQDALERAVQQTTEPPTTIFVDDALVSTIDDVPHKDSREEMDITAYSENFVYYTVHPDTWPPQIEFVPRDPNPEWQQEQYEA